MTGPGFSPPLPDDASFTVFLGIVRRRRRWLIGLPLLIGAGAVLGGLLEPRTWSARTSILPQRADMTRGGLGALATQFGLNLNLNEAGQTPAFYTELLRTPQVLGDVAETSFRLVRPKPDSGTLIQLLKLQAADSAVARERAIQRLRNMTLVRGDDQVGLVRVTVKSYSPELSSQIAHRMVELVNEFNVARRRTSAMAERHFTEARRELAAEEMAAAETRLMRFLESNRNYSGSPALQATRDRLQRELSLKAQIYSSISQAFEQARIDEVRDTPVITVIEAPDVPARPDSRRLVVRLAVALLVGLVLGLAVSLFLEFDGPSRLAALRRSVQRP